MPQTVAALESVGSPVATVLRTTGSGGEGRLDTIQTDDVVPGDIIEVKIGDVVPADARIIPGHLSSLECDEALLTGESLPSVKTKDPLDDPDCPVGDRTCMIYSGSQVTKGRARCVVTATGMQTELGKIAAAMQRKETRKETGWKARWVRQSNNVRCR
jgi:Na+-exporting ATPase